MIVFLLACVAMVPEYWLTEGGQSATGALLDHLLENHVAAPFLANRAASQSKLLSAVVGSGIYYRFLPHLVICE